MLAFEPMDFGPLFGAPRGRGTIGGVLAANASGPRRIKAGAARDHVLGIHAVSGRGEAFKSGGRVVKNVTGYDLSKGLAGSWGTLAVVTDATFKVLPKPETLATLVVAGLDDLTAVTALCKAMGTPLDVSGAAHLPGRAGGEVPDAAVRLRRPGRDADPPGGLCALGRLPRPEADGGARRLGQVSVLEADASEALWRAVRDAEVFGATQHPRLASQRRAERRPDASIAALKDEHADPLFLRLVRRARSGSRSTRRPEPHGLARDIRTAVAAAGGGHATLMRGSPALRAAVPPFEPQPEALAALSRRLKAAVRPARHPQSGADGGGRLMQTQPLLPRAACRPEHRGSGFDPSPLRALRLLPRHLPDLSGARQRARFAARTEST